MRKIKKIFALLLTACLTAGALALPQDAQAAEGEMVTGKKTGWEIQYKVLKEGMDSGQERKVQVAKVVQNLSSGPYSGRTITIPGDAYIYDGWETTRVFAVDSIGAGAFADCAQIEDVATVKIEGAVTLEPGALDGIPAEAVFQVASLAAKRALLEYGIAEERITYTGVKSKYVAFGDSIAAGYRLPDYQDDGGAVSQWCFTEGLYQYLQETSRFAAASCENFAVSGTTSFQLLNQIKRGDYDNALKDADMITLTIGSNDLLGPFIDIVKKEIEDSGIEEIFEKDKITIRDMQKALKKIPGIIDNLNAGLQYDGEHPGNDELLAACESFISTQQEILDRLSVLAPEAKIYWTTLYNPFYGQTLDLAALFPTITENMQGLNPLPLGDLAAPYIEKMNSAFDTPDLRYERVDLYEAFNHVGYTNVNISGNAAEGTLVIDLDPHPNAVGHGVIAEILEKAVENSFNPSDLPADQSGAKSMLTFSLEGTEGAIDEAAGKITVTLPYGTDVSGLTAAFTISDKAEVYVGDVLQESGVTKNDFTGGKVYRVKAEIGTFREYTVNVTVKDAPEKKQDNTPVSGNDAADGKGKKAAPPATGDNVPVLWYMLAALLAGSVIVLYFRKLRMKMKRKERI